MANWLLLIIVGCLVYAFTLAPAFPAGWRPFAQAMGGILVAVGLLVLVLGLLGISLPT